MNLPIKEEFVPSTFTQVSPREPQNDEFFPRGKHCNPTNWGEQLAVCFFLRPFWHEAQSQSKAWVGGAPEGGQRRPFKV